MKTHVRLIAGALVALTLSCLTASAAVFDVIGSNGWTDAGVNQLGGPGTPSYATDSFTGGATPLSGNAALVYDDVEGDPGRGVDYLFAAPLTGKVEIKYNLYVPSGHYGASFVTFYLRDATDAYDLSSWGGLYMNPPSAPYDQIEEWTFGVTGPAVSRDVWQEIKMAFDFDAGTLQYFKDGVAIGNPQALSAMVPDPNDPNTSIGPFTATKLLGFGLPTKASYTGTAWTGPVYFDNFSVVHNGTTIWSENFDSYIVASPLAASAGSAKSVSGTSSVVIGGSPTATGGTAPYTYSWTPTTGLDNPTSANPTASPSSTTTYTVVVRDNVGATASSSVTVTYLPPDPSLISVDFVVGTAGNTTTPASGDTSASGAVKNAAGLTFIGQSGPWNAFNVDGGYGNFTYASAGPSDFLLNGAGGTTTVKFAITASYRCATGDGAKIGYLRNETGALYDAYGMSANPVTWEITGLVPNGHYKLVMFSEGAAGTFSANAIDAVRDSEGDANWEDVVADGDGKISGSLAGNVNDFIPMFGFQLYQLPVAATLAANAGPAKTVIGSSSVVIGGSPTATGGTPPYTYSWTPTTGLNNAASANPTASPTSTTTYTVQVTDSVGAKASSSVVVTYVALDPTLISVDFVVGKGSNMTAPASGDTSASGAVKNATGLTFVGQSGPWNAFNVDSAGLGNSTYGSAGPSDFLVNAGGATTTVKFAITASYRCAVGDNTKVGYLRNEAGALYDYYGLSANPVTWEITGLVPNDHYKLVMFSEGSSGTFSANGVDAARDSEGDANWEDLQADVDGKISGSLAGNVNDYIPMFGFQMAKLASSATPNPTVTGIIMTGPGQFAIQGSMPAAGTVVVEKTTSLAGTIVWDPVMTQPLPAGAFSIPVTNTTDPQAFYRVVGQ